MFKSQDALKKLNSSLNKAVSEGGNRKGCCFNLMCNKKSDDLAEATAIARGYFGVSKEEKSWKICNDCRCRAKKFERDCIKEIKEHGTLTFKSEPWMSSSDSLKFLKENDLERDLPSSKVNLAKKSTAGGGSKKSPSAHLDKKKSATASNPSDMIDIVAREDLNREINSIMEKFSLVKLVNMSKEALLSEISTLEEDIKHSTTKMEKMESELTDLQVEYSKVANSKYKPVHLGSVNIRSNGSISIQEDPSLTGQLKGLAVNVPPKEVIAFRKTVTAEPSLVDLSASDADDESQPEVPDVPAKRRKSVHQNSPTKAYCGMRQGVGNQILVFEVPKPEQIVYFMVNNLIDRWEQSRVLDVREVRKNEHVFTIMMQRNEDIPKCSDESSQHESGIILKRLGKEIAFAKPLKGMKLSVGARVIGKFGDILGNDRRFKGLYYAGIVAETPSPSNNNRYLLFFDDGFAQYTKPDEVLPIVESSNVVWNDVDERARDFTRDYLNNYPNNFRVVADVGQHFEIEYGGKWITAEVLELDSSLMKVQYPNPKGKKLQLEWIFRGSPRINRTKSYKQVELELEDVARKFENAGSFKKVVVPKHCPRPKKFGEHTCTPSCAHVYDENLFRKISPLVVPFHLGWARIMDRTRQGLIEVHYKTPCGRSLTKYDEIHMYNQVTKNNIPIEFFSLESSIDCLNMFQVERKITHIKDVSYGKEWTPVECVNSLNKEVPVAVDYLSKSEPGEGVDFKLDNEFLACCDCKDDCRDKSKCACWKLTLSGFSFAKKSTTRRGYEFRRLKSWIESGIYECNVKCQCRANSCLNRVVQNKVSWPVQVFRTAKKGWGVRALYDIPQGSFLCLYTGKLLNDAAATQEGLSHGDEYLADLDFIETMEARKPDYESDCTDIEEEENREKPDKGHKPRIPLARKSTGCRKLTDLNGLENKEMRQKFVVAAQGKPVRYREYFGDSEKPWSVDGKSRGNFGRYFNHSCNPNLFIQSVFVDTHDLRFPWVAFFTKEDVKAGTELCWDYKYQVGSVPGRYLQCRCGAKQCRGRLL